MSKLQETITGLKALRDELLAELAVIEKMLALAEPKPKPKPAPHTGHSMKARATRNGQKNGQKVSAETRKRVKDAVLALQGPASTSEIAGQVSGVSQSTVAKTLRTLADEDEIKQAGYQSGVKGRRPLWAPNNLIEDIEPGTQFTRELEPVQ